MKSGGAHVERERERVRGIENVLFERQCERAREKESPNPANNCCLSIKMVSFDTVRVRGIESVYFCLRGSVRGLERERERECQNPASS